MLPTKLPSIQLAMPNLPPQVRPTEPGFMKMLRKYIIVEQHIRRLRLTTRLNWRDLGLEDGSEKFETELMRLGEKFLLPSVPATSQFYDAKHSTWTYRNLFNSVESTARDRLDPSVNKVVVRFSKWGAAIPLSSFNDFDADMKERYDRYMAIGDELVRSDEVWESHIARFKEEYRAFAKESAARFAALMRGKGSKETPKTTDEYFEMLWQEVKMPTAKAFRNSLAFEVKYSFIDWTPWADESVKDRIIEDLRGAAKTRAEVEAVEEVMRRKTAEAANLGEAMIADAAKFFNNLVYQTLLECLESIKKNDGAVSGQTSRKLRNLWQSAATFVTDKNSDQFAISERLQELALTDELTPDMIQKMMSQIVMVTRDTLIQLEEQPRSARDLGIPDKPSYQEVKRARIALDAPIFTANGDPIRPGLDRE